MIQYTNTRVQKVYYQFETSNKSFLDMHHYLKDTGVKNNKFFLILTDPDLAGINPRDPRLNMLMKQKVLRECICNYWYFLREVIRIPDQGGAANGGKPYQLHRGNLALNFCMIYNWNTFTELPRQHGKTIAVICRQLWTFLFGTSNSEMVFINKKFEDSKLNLQRLKDIRDALPSYLRMQDQYGPDGKKLKVKNSVETLEHPFNGNRIKTLASARNKVAANSLGRGMTIPLPWFDEYAFIPYNDIIYLAMVPAFKTASQNAKKNHAPYGITITTTPGDMTTDEGTAAYAMKEAATEFTELWYDKSPEQIQEILSKNTESSFIHIKFTYQQLGSSEQWFKETVIDMKKDWSAIRREVLLEWSKASDNSPFKKEDLNIVKALLKQPIQQIMLGGMYTFNIYEKFDLRYPPLIGVDVSGGFKRDASAITIVDSKTTRVVADFNCNFISTPDLASVIYELVTKYMSNAVVNIERNGGFGASVLAKLIKTRIKRNLFYEIKDKVIEERSVGMNTVKKTQKTKIYGLDNTHNVRELLMEILRQRMEYHKDKFISPIIFSELETLEVKKNGRIEHTSTGHDDQVFSYLMALYIWYEGRDLMERWGIEKSTIKTDQDAEEAIVNLEEDYKNIVVDLERPDEDEDPAEIKKQLDYLASDKTMGFEQWMQSQAQQDRESLNRLLNTKLGKMAYMEKYHKDEDYMAQQGLYTIPNSVFMNDDTIEQ